MAAEKEEALGAEFEEMRAEVWSDPLKVVQIC